MLVPFDRANLNPNRVDVSLPSPEDRNGFSSQNVVLQFLEILNFGNVHHTSVINCLVSIVH
jgi:hypothetical protein